MVSCAKNGIVFRVFFWLDYRPNLMYCKNNKPVFYDLFVLIASAMDKSVINSVEILARSYGLRILGIADKPLTRDKLIPLLHMHPDEADAAATRSEIESLTAEEIRGCTLHPSKRNALWHLVRVYLQEIRTFY
jgi:hypothetical protein